MSSWPILDREPVQLPALAGHDGELWSALIELSALRPREWTLIGGQMVFLHAMEHGIAPPRVSTDLHVLVNARVVTGGVREFVVAIEEVGFVLVGASPEGIAYRYRRRGVSVDVLAPEGLGPRTDLTTTPPGRTLQVPGGTQALDRTELVPVAFGDKQGLVPRPSLLGALVGKAVAVEVDDVPDAQRLDLALLSASSTIRSRSLVNSPRRTASGSALGRRWPTPNSEHGPAFRMMRPIVVVLRSGSSLVDGPSRAGEDQIQSSTLSARVAGFGTFDPLSSPGLSGRIAVRPAPWPLDLSSGCPRARRLSDPSLASPCREPPDASRRDSRRQRRLGPPVKRA